MLITLEEAKQYLRVDTGDDDELLISLIRNAERMCADVARVSVYELEDGADDNIRAAILYTVAYSYEHREEADYHALTLSLRHMMFGIRKEGF